MTSRRDLENHRRSLTEIRNIMNSMKTLAYLETRKLARFMGAQQAVVQNIETAAADLLRCHPDILPDDVEEKTAVYILVGTERGFCGDFNHALLKHFGAIEQDAVESRVIVVGRKLHGLLETDARVTAFIPGASVAEEITSLLQQAIVEVGNLQQQYGLIGVYCLYHGGNDGVVMQKLIPPFQHYRAVGRDVHHPPLLNLPPEELLFTLIEHYLFALLNEIFCTSLMTENHHRVSHLEGAVKRLDEQADQLARKCNALRQEELIEEIEVILLSAAATK